MVNNKKEQTGVYFENLNAIRFIAASLVIIFHTESVKELMHLPTNYRTNFVGNFGGTGVILFFVLSGFLISFLLFKEKEKTKTVSVRNFYIRRVLRIWPLYFFIIICGFFIFPFIGFLDINKTQVWSDLFYKLLLVLFFLPNLLLNIYGIIPYISQIWSIGAEEQFYLVWPLLNKYFKSKWLIIFMVIFFYFFVRILFHYFLPYNNFTDTVRLFLKFTPITCMAIGAIFALIIYENSPVTVFLRKVLFLRITQVITFCLLFAYMYFGFESPFYYESYSILFGIIICNLASNKKRLFSMENPVSNYLGKISYGLYMYHPVIIAGVIKLLQYFSLLNNFLLYLLVFLFTIIVSALSYSFFERRFIKLKVKYSDIISGDNVKA